ncbi:MAG: hypothetical protein V4667_12335 [Bacteroidota bacterium]
MKLLKSIVLFLICFASQVVNAQTIIKEKNKYGLKDSKKENWLLLPEYDSLYFQDGFNDKFVFAYKNGKVGIINYNTKKITFPFIYNYVLWKNENINLFLVTNEKIKEPICTDDIQYVPSTINWGIADSTGKLLQPIDGRIAEDIYAPLYFKCKGGTITKTNTYIPQMFKGEKMNDLPFTFFETTNGKLGIINKADGKIILPFEYDYIAYYNTYDAFLGDSQNCFFDLICAKQNNKPNWFKIYSRNFDSICKKIPIEAQQLSQKEIEFVNCVNTSSACYFELDKIKGEIIEPHWSMDTVYTSLKSISDSTAKYTLKKSETEFKKEYLIIENGFEKTFYDNGNLKSIFFRKGCFGGNEKIYYNNGQLKEEILYLDYGVGEEIHKKTYYESGQLKEEVFYDENYLRKTNKKTYYENGQFKEEILYDAYGREIH